MYLFEQGILTRVSIIEMSKIFIKPDTWLYFLYTTLKYMRNERQLFVSYFHLVSIETFCIAVIWFFNIRCPLIRWKKINWIVHFRFDVMKSKMSCKGDKKVRVVIFTNVLKSAWINRLDSLVKKSLVKFSEFEPILYIFFFQIGRGHENPFS